MADLLDLSAPAKGADDVASAAPAAATTEAAALDLGAVLGPPPVASTPLTTSTAPAAAPAAALAASPIVAPAAAAAPAAAGADAFTFGDDDWSAFQGASAGSAAAPAAAPAVAPAVVPAAAPAVTPAAAPAAASVTSDFDPFNSSPPEPKQDASSAAPGGLELFSASDLGALGTQAATQPTQGSDNLISFGTMDEFDPVAQTAFKEQPAPVAAAPAPAAASTAAAELAPSAAAPAATTAASANIEVGEAYPAAPVAGAAAPATSAADDLLDLGGGAKASNDTQEVLGADLGIEVEDHGKKVIYIYHKGEKNVVGWYADMKAPDIKEAILCACDAIMDGGFVLREVHFTDDDEGSAEAKEDGKVFQYEQFGELENGQTYIIEAAGEREDLKSITGDRWRRLKVQIEPLLHVEAQKAIERMRRGSNLLKHTHYGFPHLRQFQLSDDRKRLVWYSGAKRKEDSVVHLDDISEIRLGQTTPVFLHYRLPMLEHLSFSLVYGPKGSKSLDVTAKDEFEFDLWVTGLKAIFYHFKNRQLSKEQLLNHSKRFKKALEKNNTGIKLTKLPEVKEKGHVGLDDCIEIVTHTPQQLDTKMERLRERLRTMSQQVARLDSHSQAEMEVDLSLLTGQGPAYASVFDRDEDAQDEEMEIRRMHELVEQTTQVLQQARNELIALNQRQKNEGNGADASSSAADAAAATQRGKKKDGQACKHIDQLLWKAEVDLENVEDMYLRHIDNQRDTATPFSAQFAEMNNRLSRTASDAFDEIKSWFR